MPTWKNTWRYLVWKWLVSQQGRVALHVTERKIDTVIQLLMNFRFISFWALQQLTSFGFSLRYWTKDCLNWPCWILILLTVSSCSDRAWNMQFPDPWLSEILKPLSDAIVANFSVKVVLLLTVLAQSCIRWRFWRVRSSSPGSKIILGALPGIIQCRWKRKSQLWQREKSITLKTEFSVHREYFFTHHHWKLRETCIWSGLAPCSMLVKPYPPKSGQRGTLIQRGTMISFHGGRDSQMNEIFPY